MSDDFDPDQELQNAINRGISAGLQYKALLDAAERCYEAADKISSLKAKVEANDRCNAIWARAKFVNDHADEIDRAIGIPSAGDVAQAVLQNASNRAYDATYWAYFGKSRADQEAAYKTYLGRDPSLPSRHAAATALHDLLTGHGYHPPWLDPNAPPPFKRPPPPSDDDKPDLGDESVAPRRLGMRTRGPRARRDDMMPQLDFCVVERRGMKTIHYVSDCPAVPADAEPQELEQPEHPLDLADRLGARPCGTCLRMLEAAAKDGLLFGKMTASHSLEIWRDRVEYRSRGLLGFGASEMIVPADEIDRLDFVSPTRLVIASPHGAIDFSYDSAAEGEIAREALSRQGWSFDDDA